MPGKGTKMKAYNTYNVYTEGQVQEVICSTLAALPRDMSAVLISGGRERVLALRQDFIEQFAAADDCFVADETLSPRWGYAQMSISPARGEWTFVFGAERDFQLPTGWRARLAGGDVVAELQHARRMLDAPRELRIECI